MSVTVDFRGAPAGSYMVYLIQKSKDYAIFVDKNIQFLQIGLSANVVGSGDITSSIAGGSKLVI